MNINPVILSIPIYFLLILIELAVQGATKRKLYRLPDALSNISCGIVQQLSGFFLKILSISTYYFVYENWRLLQFENEWYHWVLLFLGADFLYYWAHRKSHEINLFWGGHVVHHQSEDYNFSVALRQSSFQVVWTFFFYLPLALIGFDPLNFILVNALVTVYQFWIHTETIGKLGWLELVLNTPSHHRVHHGKNPKYIDKNHAGVLIIWDKIFGTFQREEETPTYGITQPLNSWNPVWANFEHYAKMGKDLKEIKGLKNKLKFVFAAPGWRPADLGGRLVVPEVNRNNYIKYETKVSKPLSVYLIIQYLGILGLTAFFLFNSSQYDNIQKSITIFLLFWSVCNVGGLSESKSWSIWSENSRWIVLIAIFVYPINLEAYFIPLVLSKFTFVWALASLVGLFFIKMKS